MLDDIKKALWATADKLRANMDAAEYKHLVLGLMFVQSEKFIEAHGGKINDVSIYVQESNPTTWRLMAGLDRNDVDGQLFGVFSLGADLLREQPVQASTRPAFRQLLANRTSGGIVFASIQKFMLGETRMGLMKGPA